MKYIITKEKHVILFSKSINHKDIFPDPDGDCFSYGEVTIGELKEEQTSVVCNSAYNSRNSDREDAKTIREFIEECY